MNSFKKLLTIKNILEIIAMIFLYAVLDNVGGIKKYIVVLLFCLIFLWLGRKKIWSADVLLCIGIPTTVYLLAGSMSALLSTNSQTETVKIFLYWMVPLLFGLALYCFYGKQMPHIVDVQFWGSFIAYKFFDDPRIFSLIPWESVYAFGFGVFAIYYAYKKRWVMFAFSMAFVYLAEKRIAILAMFVALLLEGIIWLFSYSKKLVLWIWGLVGVAVYGYIFSIYSGFMEALCWAANINTNGRVEMYSRMANEFEFSLGYLGEGIGIVEYLLEHWNISTYSNLHNDLLKFYIELGFLGLLLFLISYGVMFHLVEKNFGKIQMNFFFAISVYSMILFATDNVSIYMIYLLPVYSTFFAVLSSDRNVKIQ